ncbi:MAG: hypothetical protein J5955_04360 [Bacilli bacterium]|nr:hypothetical protein [Bacilli bacterium]
MKKLKYILPSLFVVTMLTGCWSGNNYYVTTKDVSASVVSTVKVGSKYENTIEFTNNGEMYVLKRRLSFNTEDNDNYQSKEKNADCGCLFDTEVLVPNGKVRTKTPYITDREISKVDFTAYCIYGKIDTSIEFSDITIEKNPYTRTRNSYLFNSVPSSTDYFMELVHVTYQENDYYFSLEKRSNAFITNKELDLNELTVKEVFGIYSASDRRDRKILRSIFFGGGLAWFFGIAALSIFGIPAIIAITILITKIANKKKNK